MQVAYFLLLTIASAQLSDATRQKNALQSEMMTLVNSGIEKCKVFFTQNMICQISLASHDVSETCLFRVPWTVKVIIAVAIDERMAGGDVGTKLLL